MKISVLTVTNRQTWRPWLTWNYEKQSWSDKELLIEWDPPSLASGRNRLLARATGAAVCWMDDDDWQHPDRLSIIARTLECSGEAVVGNVRSLVINAFSLRGRWEVLGPWIFNGAGFRLHSVSAIKFDPSRYDEDWYWTRSVSQATGPGAVLNAPLLHAWLAHDENRFNRRARGGFNTSPGEVAQWITDWAEVQARLSTMGFHPEQA